MKVEIFDAKSQDWQKVCAPAQQEMTAERGGIILVILAKTDEEARHLSDFGSEIARLKNPIHDNIYQEYSDDCRKTYFIAYQICSEDNSFKKCFEIAADLLKLLGKFFVSVSV